MGLTFEARIRKVEHGTLNPLVFLSDWWNG